MLRSASNWQKVPDLQEVVRRASALVWGGASCLAPGVQWQWPSHAHKLPLSLPFHVGIWNLVRRASTTEVSGTTRSTRESANPVPDALSVEFALDTPVQTKFTGSRMTSVHTRAARLQADHPDNGSIDKCMFTE